MRFPYKGKPKNNFGGKPKGQKPLEDQKSEKNSVVEEFKGKLSEINCLSDLKLRDIVAPSDGWASRLAQHFRNKFKVTQLRKLFNEIKNATKKADSDLENAKEILWRIYPLIAYAEAPSRKLIPRDFAEILYMVIEKVENCEDESKLKESFKRLEDFMTALYAYFKKYDRGG